MKIVQSENGKQKINLNQKEWQDIGKKAGWIKIALNEITELSGTVKFYTTGRDDAFQATSIPLIMVITSAGYQDEIDLVQTTDPDLKSIYKHVMESYGEKIKALVGK